MADSQEQVAEEFGLNEELPEGWRPEEGSVLIGKVIGLTKGWSDYQQQYYPIVMVEDEATGKPVAVHAFHFVLMDRLTSLRPVLGERIGIKMGAKVPLKGNPKQTVQTYTVKVEGRTEDVWNEVKTPRTQAPAAQVNAPATAIESDDDIPF